MTVFKILTGELKGLILEEINTEILQGFIDLDDIDEPFEVEIITITREAFNSLPEFEI